MPDRTRTWMGSRLRRCGGRLPPAFSAVGHTWALDLTFWVSPNGLLAQYGLPTAIRTDNEAMFTSQLWGVALKALGILHHRAPPGQPWRNGRIERLFGTLKPLLRKIKPTSVAVLQNALAEFIHFYNHVRPHQNLAGLTPLEAWQGKCLADVQQVHTQAQGNGFRLWTACWWATT